MGNLVTDVKGVKSQMDVHSIRRIEGSFHAPFISFRRCVWGGGGFQFLSPPISSSTNLMFEQTKKTQLSQRPFLFGPEIPVLEVCTTHWSESKCF